MTTSPDAGYDDAAPRRQAPQAALQPGRRADTLSAIELDELLNGPGDLS